MSLLGKKSEGPLMAHRGSSEEHVSRAAPAEDLPFIAIHLSGRSGPNYDCSSAQRGWAPRLSGNEIFVRIFGAGLMPCDLLEQL